MQNIDFDLVTIPPVFLILNERKHHTNRKHWITLNSSETHRRMHDIILHEFFRNHLQSNRGNPAKPSGDILAFRDEIRFICGCYEAENASKVI
jgi:hypothetical protein